MRPARRAGRWFRARRSLRCSRRAAAARPSRAAVRSRSSCAAYHLLPATRADLLRRLGRMAEAADAYWQALALASTGAERRYLTRRLAEVQ